MGKGVVSSFFAQVAQKGYQLVYGATANLFTDRYGNYIGFGPEESELAAIADLDTFAVLPWDDRVARVYCDCYDTETGKLMDADPRQNLKAIAHDFEQELGYQFLIGIEPEMMWLRKPREGEAPQGVTKPYCYHIHQFEELRPVLLDVVYYGKALGLDMSYGDHEDAPGQLELNFRFDRPLRTADNITTYRQVCAAVGRKHDLLPTFMPKPFTGVSANGHHHHFTLIDERGNNVFHDPDGPAQLSQFARHFLGGMLEHFPALMCIGNPTVNSYCRMWDTGFWAPIYKNWGWQNRTTTVRVASGGRFEYRGVDSSCNPYLTVASLLRAGLDGVRREIDPGPPQQGNTYDLLAEGAEIEKVPDSLGKALEALEDETFAHQRCPAASTRSSTTTSETSGSATWPPSPTGSATSTWRCRDHSGGYERIRGTPGGARRRPRSLTCQRHASLTASLPVIHQSRLSVRPHPQERSLMCGIAGDHLQERQRRAPDRPRHHLDAAVDEASRAGLDRLRALSAPTGEYIVRVNLAESTSGARMEFADDVARRRREVLTRIKGGRRDVKDNEDINEYTFRPRSTITASSSTLPTTSSRSRRPRCCRSAIRWRSSRTSATRAACRPPTTWTATSDRTGSGMCGWRPSPTSTSPTPTLTGPTRSPTSRSCTTGS